MFMFIYIYISITRGPTNHQKNMVFVYENLCLFCFNGLRAPGRGHVQFPKNLGTPKPQDPRGLGPMSWVPPG